MGIILGKFEMPNKLIRDEKTASATFARFVAEPFERGYGYTIGNSMRRVLLSSIEGAAVTSVKIEGVPHEFSTISGMEEDVVELVMNIKKLLVKMHTRETKTLLLRIEKKGAIKASDITQEATVEILNPNLHLCTLNEAVKLNIELEVNVGRGYRSADENKKEGKPIGAIPISSDFTPVRKVKYYVENTRIGQITDFDKLTLEITTDARIDPNDALKQSSTVLKKHLNVFVDYDEDYIQFEEKKEEDRMEEQEIEKIMNLPISEIELSVRSANCIAGADISSIGELASKNENEMLKYRNFGKKSLNEIKDVLTELGLTLGMSKAEIYEALKARRKKK
ncbi:MAG: DNA-directed RNA polymerase subunit alpha [Candidatus Aureabacteria bacterium]|nr:DNA-directed RNA polymerase subunit alpha [Candidatus Auribacterota bacterium]